MPFTASLHNSLTNASLLAIDEVGRGCVAGPVHVCVSFWVSHTRLKSLGFPHSFFKKQNWLPLVGDSKKLSSKKREACFEAILKDFQSVIPTPVATRPPKLYSPKRFVSLKEAQGAELKALYFNIPQHSYECVAFQLGAASAQEVDAVNIWNAVQLASGRALTELRQQAFFAMLQKKPLFAEMHQAVILMDGKLVVKVPKPFDLNLQLAVINADEQFIPVGFSSILAKVYRDHFMKNQHEFFPHYGFDAHKGYGTQKHFSQIQSHGLCPLHRLSFLKNTSANFAR